MNRDEVRRERDPALWHQVRSRLARIKMKIAIREVDELVREDSQRNLIEQSLLGQRCDWPQYKKEEKDG